MQSTSGHFLPVIITIFSALAFAAILLVIFGVIIRRRKESIKKQRTKNKKHDNQFKFDDGFEKYDDITDGNEMNSYEAFNYEIDGYDTGVYDKINQNESKIEANKTVEYLEMSYKN